MLRTFLKNPLGTLSTIHQLRSIPIGIGLLDPLVELLVKPVREKQRVNNPYNEANQPDLYDAFAVSRYERYVTGRMASLLALKGGGKVLKASKYTDELQTFVRNARIGKLADIVNDDVPAARVGVSVGDEDRTRVVQESDSAGSAVRQNERFQRNDGDASDVPDGQADEIVAYSQKGNRVALDGDYSQQDLATVTDTSTPMATRSATRRSDGSRVSVRRENLRRDPSRPDLKQTGRDTSGSRRRWRISSTHGDTARTGEKPGVSAFPSPTTFYRYATEKRS